MKCKLLQKMLLAAICLLSISFVTGCKDNKTENEDTSNWQETKSEDKKDLEEQADEKDNDTPDENDVEKKEAETKEMDEALAAYVKDIRAELEETSALFAVAYMGYVKEDTIDLDDWLEKMYTGFSYYQSIEQIIGTSGDLFCLVPRDPLASVAVNRVVTSADGAEVAEVLYRSEEGEPFFLFPDLASDDLGEITVTISDNAGNFVTWFPFIDDVGSVVLPINDNAEDLALDISDYWILNDKGITSYYRNSGWYEPDDYTSIVDTTWEYGQWYLEFEFDFEQPDPYEGSMELYYVLPDGSGISDVYQGQWYVENGLLTLQMTAEDGSYDGVDDYRIMLDSESEMLWIITGENGTILPFVSEAAESVTFMRTYG